MWRGWRNKVALSVAMGNDVSIGLRRPQPEGVRMSDIARVDGEGSVFVDGGRVGRVERRESVGPRGGAVVEWVAHSPFLPSAVYRTRAAAVAEVAAAWSVNDRADAYPSSVAPCPCGDVFVDGVCGACGTCSGCDACEVADDDGERAYARAMNAQPSQLGSVAAAVVLGLQGVTVTFHPAGTVATIHREGETGASRTRVKLFNDDAHTYAVVADAGGDYDAVCTDDAAVIVDWVCNELGVLPVGPSVSVWVGGRLLHEVAGDDARDVLRDSLQFHAPDCGAVIVGTDKHAYAAGGWQAHSEAFGVDECVVCGDHIEYCAGHGGDGPGEVVRLLATRYPLRAYYAREDDAVAGIEAPDAGGDARVRVRAVNGERLYRVTVTLGASVVGEDYADECPYSLASVILSVTGIDARES